MQVSLIPCWILYGSVPDKSCFSVSESVSIPDTVSQFWTGCDWNIPLSLPQMSHFFNHIMVREEQDIPNWILNESGRFTLKSATTFFLEPGVPGG